MSTLRKRNIEDINDDKSASTHNLELQEEKETVDEAGDTSMPGSGDDDDIISLNLSDNTKLCQGATDNTTESLDSALKHLPPKWRNWIVRGIFSTIMISSFCFIIYLGPLALVALIFLVQIKCFHEIITIGYVVYKSHELPWFRTLSWYFLLASNYFFYGESMIQYFGVLLSRTVVPPSLIISILPHYVIASALFSVAGDNAKEFLSSFVTYHRFIAFSFYCGGFVAFVFSLVKKHYLKQFTLFGWTHVTLVLIVTQSHLIIQNIFDGIIWFLVPVSMIICNDIMAYVFGFFFGKTPLIKLSPKKTWEGFIGGAFATVVFGIIISAMLLPFNSMVCPIDYDFTKEQFSNECERGYVFNSAAYNLPGFVVKTLSAVGSDITTVQLYPFLLHSVSLSVFASIIGPFGGFFASGFKRAFKIKDFSDTIPGHGGFMDRFDCQLLMATFVHVYQSSFIKAAAPQRLLQHILSMKPDDQLLVFRTLNDTLTKAGILP